VGAFFLPAVRGCPPPAAAGRACASLEVVLRIVQSAGKAEEVARLIPALAAAGVAEIIVDLDWDADLASQHDLLRGAAA
jgi:hypothetical protein